MVDWAWSDQSKSFHLESRGGGKVFPSNLYFRDNQTLNDNSMKGSANSLWKSDGRWLSNMDDGRKLRDEVIY